MELSIGSTFPIKHKVYWRGEPTDADALPVVTVYDVTEDPTANPPINPNSILYTLTAEKSEVDIGVYQVSLPVNGTYKSRDLKLRWSYQINANAQVREHKVFVIQPYVDIEQSIDSLGLGEDPSDPEYKTYSQLRSAERYARKNIENYTGQKFYLYNETFSIYGSDSDTLLLPEKLYDLHKLYVNDILLIDKLTDPDTDNWNYDIDIVESGFGIRINRANLLDNTVYTANGMVPPTIHDGDGIFKSGNRYTVVGSFGYPNVPDNVELAAIELMKDFFAKDNTWRNKYIGELSTFDWDFKYTSGAHSGTGNLYADKLLEDFVLSKIVII
jgi:hypothetical protein